MHPVNKLFENLFFKILTVHHYHSKSPNARSRCLKIAEDLFLVNFSGFLLFLFSVSVLYIRMFYVILSFFLPLFGFVFDVSRGAIDMKIINVKFYLLSFLLERDFEDINLNKYIFSTLKIVKKFWNHDFSSNLRNFCHLNYI